MATTKTLTPTNQTISIPELTDAPDMSVPADALSKEADAINSLNSKIDDNVKSVTNASWNTYPGQSCVRHCHYESGTAASTYGVPANFVDVTTIWHSAGRAVAFAIEWATGTGRIPGRIWTNAMHDSWQGWKELAFKSDVVHFKSVTIPKATAGTSWSQTSRNIGTVSDLFGVADSKLVNAMVYDAGFNPAANATVGTFNGNVFVAATQATTLSSDVKVRVAYID